MAIKLTARQRTFVMELVWAFPTITQAEASRRAGYEDKDASHAGYQLLKRPHVRAEFARQWAKKEELLKLQSLAGCDRSIAIASATPTDILDKDGKLRPFSEWPDNAKVAISGIEVDENGIVERIKFFDPNPSHRTNLQYAGKLKDKLELEAPGLTLDQLVPKRKPLSTEGSK